MTPHHVVALCLRLVAIIWLLYTLSHVHSLFMYLNAPPEIAIRGPVVWLVAFLQIATCAVLWFFPVTIATKLLPSAAAMPERPVPPSLIEWQTLGVICIGLWGLSRAIPDAIYWLTFFNMRVTTEYGSGDLDPEQMASVITTLAEIAISAWLLFGAKGFAAFLFKLRTGGVAK